MITIPQTPFFTIITATFNASATLPRLLDSLASQTCRDFNWIVQDGASSDATMEIVTRYSDRLPEILADSSRDNGIYDAWNKAISHWSPQLGEWILFLGADDKLHTHETLSQCKDYLSLVKNDVVFASGNVCMMNTQNEIVTALNVDISTAFARRYYGMSFPHSGLFHRRDILQKIKFDPQFNIAGDYDFFLKSISSESQITKINQFVTDMYIGGISSNPNNFKKLYCENLKIIRKHSISHYIYYGIENMWEMKKNDLKIFLSNNPCGRILLLIFRKLKRHKVNP
ncbi:glycosyltransferase family 2 protein [uncultured Desulfovibrio sp.]|uniref:glycosyltransferase family 2 protein n=1 Tax=uncultured Desulfovibrio sp. TaxID=167968 RepID=UPI00261259A1|nr:glycosyltransferase family 2 protein [uncultured Desulfovibrio sp.]